MMYLSRDIFTEFCKEAGSALRDRVSVHKLESAGQVDSNLANSTGRATDKYVMKMNGKTIGQMHVREDGSVLKSVINDKFRGQGLGRKMYGEVGRLMPSGVSLRSDQASVSGAATKLWEDFAERPTGGMQAEKNPLFKRVITDADDSMRAGTAQQVAYKPVSVSKVRGAENRSAFQLNVPDKARRVGADVAPARKAMVVTPPATPTAPVPTAPAHALVPRPTAPVPTAPVSARAGAAAVHPPAAIQRAGGGLLRHVTPGRVVAGAGVLAAGGLLAHHFLQKKPEGRQGTP